MSMKSPTIKNFMERVEAKNLNTKIPLFYVTELYRVYYSVFGDTNDADNNILPYGEDIQYKKDVEANEAYIEALDNYIGAKLVVPYKYSIPFLSQVKRRKRYASGNPIGEEHSNPIFDTRVYELELPNRIVDEYAVNIFTENIFDQFDYQEWIP